MAMMEESDRMKMWFSFLQRAPLPGSVAWRFSPAAITPAPNRKTTPWRRPYHTRTLRLHYRRIPPSKGVTAGGGLPSTSCCGVTRPLTRRYPASNDRTIFLLNRRACCAAAALKTKRTSASLFPFLLPPWWLLCHWLPVRTAACIISCLISYLLLLLLCNVPYPHLSAWCAVTLFPFCCVWYFFARLPNYRAYPR